MSVITTTELEAYMGQELELFKLQSIVDAVNGYVEQITHRSFGGTKTVTESYDWAPRIYLRHMDIASVDNVKVGLPNNTQQTLDSSIYTWNNYGRLILYYATPRSYSPNVFYSDYLQITYTYGVATVPADLKLAALGVAAGFYNWAVNAQKDIVSTSVGSYRVEYAGAIRNSGNAAPSRENTVNNNWAIIESYAMQRA